VGEPQNKNSSHGEDERVEKRAAKPMFLHFLLRQALSIAITSKKRKKKTRLPSPQNPTCSYLINFFGSSCASVTACYGPAYSLRF
jgi:hypothetical protein